jgi:hypothetical protein
MTMTATAPITQDVLTIPRKTPEGGKVNLVGLTREGLRAALIEAGTPEKQARMRCGQIWQWIYQKGVRDFFGHDEPRQGVSRRACERISRFPCRRSCPGRSASTERGNT